MCRRAPFSFVGDDEKEFYERIRLFQFGIFGMKDCFIDFFSVIWYNKIL